MTDGPLPGSETDEPRIPPPTDYGVAFSPRQVAGGFAILAALLVLLVRRRRRKKG
jgi:MYXO-CTERM domain-containing protein